MKTRNIKKWKKPKIVFIMFLVFFVILFIQLCYISLFTKVYGIDMQAFAKNRNTYKTTLKALRGNIYTSDETVLAQTVSSYTVIAYLSPSRTGNSKKPLHVVDKVKTAETLAPHLNMTKERILELLSLDLYQVELGPGGRDITELKKEEIEALELPGIDFIEDTKRYYPNGDFASYIVGYAKKNGTDIVGELGIEAKYNDELSGKDGAIVQQQDRYGYKIPDTPETNIPAENGNDIYLTIDANVQRFVENVVDKITETGKPEWVTISVMEAKTGRILGSASSPSFDPNKLNITNYENPLVSFAYEPGSVMKIFTYLCAMENGVYNGKATYKSGSITIDGTIIYDHNKYGWGTISYDLGLERSSNVAVATMMQTILSRDQLKRCLVSFGFGSKTGVKLPRELTGSLNFKYDVETAAASFGQGITTTPIQQLQALSIIANDGTMLKPQIIDKIVDTKTGETIYKSEVEKVENVASKDNVKYIRELMYNVVNSTRSGVTGAKYKIKGYDVIGKTGTAQYFNKETGSYSFKTLDYIYSFSGMFPKDNPDVIIFATAKKPNNFNSLPNGVTTLMKDIATYRNTFNNEKTLNTSNSYVLSDYRGSNIEEVEKLLKEQELDPVLIGNGKYIIDQYPKKNITVLDNDHIILVTNDDEIKIPDFMGWSKKDIQAYAYKAGIEVEFEGYGYAYEQNLEANYILKEKEKLLIKLKDKEI